MAETFDYIICGAGSAGCVLANRLSADPANKVLLLEQGGHDRRFWSRIPVGYYKAVYDPKMSRTFATEPSDGTAGRSVPWPRGRMIGGSSSINGLIFIRGQHQDFDDWEALGADGWGWRDVLPHFRKLECYQGGESQWRGALGELQVSELRDDNPACAAWLASAEAWGLPHTPDFNGETTEYQYDNMNRREIASADPESQAADWYRYLADESRLGRTLAFVFGEGIPETCDGTSKPDRADRCDG